MGTRLQNSAPLPRLLEKAHNEVGYFVGNKIEDLDHVMPVHKLGPYYLQRMEGTEAQQTYLEMMTVLSWNLNSNGSHMSIMFGGLKRGLIRASQLFMIFRICSLSSGEKAASAFPVISSTWATTFFLNSTSRATLPTSRDSGISSSFVPRRLAVGFGSRQQTASFVVR